MQTITDIIQPITLLSGSHADTGSTGRGCFMNVIAYLNGEPQITDQSECVCFVVRPIAIWLNDYLGDKERVRLLPYIERAMGSTTDDRAEILRRVNLAITMANECASAASDAASAASDAASYAASAARAASAASDAASDAASYAARAASDAASAASYAARAARKRIIEACFAFLDAALPVAAEPEPAAVERAERLVCLTERG